MSDDPATRRAFERLAMSDLDRPLKWGTQAEKHAAQQHARLIELMRTALSDDDDDAWMEDVVALVDEPEEAFEPNARSPGHGSWWTIAAGIAAALLLVWLLPRGPVFPSVDSMLSFSVRLVDRPHTIRDSGPDLAAGDTIELSVPGRVAQLSLYRDDGRMVARCGRDRPCIAQGGRSMLNVTLPAVGRYTAVVARGRGKLPARTSSIDHDTAALLDAGFKVRVYPAFVAQ